MLFTSLRYMRYSSSSICYLVIRGQPPSLKATKRPASLQIASLTNLTLYEINRAASREISGIPDALGDFD